MKKTLIIVWSLAFAACIPIKSPSVTPVAPPVLLNDPTFPQQCADIWQQELGRAIDAPAAASCLDQFQHGVSGGTIRAVVHDSPEGVAHRTVKPLPPVPPTPPAPAWTVSQIKDLQGDLMIWCPALPVPPGYVGGARGIDAGWRWTLDLPRYSAADRETFYGCVKRDGYTHVPVQVVADCLTQPRGYHDLYNQTPAECATYGTRAQTVINELKARTLIPLCAGVSPDAKLAPGIDPASCPVAMSDWDNSCDADARIRAIGDTFPRSTLLYYELPTDCMAPKPDPGTPLIGVAPDNGGHWIAGVQKKYPNFVGVMYELNTPDGVASNLANLATLNGFWRDIQQVWFESDTYWKFWEALPNVAQRAYNDNILRLAPQLKGCMSGCSSHPIIPDAPTGAGVLGDTLDLRTAIIEHDDADMAAWPITTTISEIAISDSIGTRVTFDKLDGANRWPDTPDYSPSGGMGPLQYSIGLCLNISGQWHCSAPIELWYGRPSEPGNIATPGQIPTNWFYDNRWGALRGYQPQVGELIGVYVVAGDARNHVAVVKERSTVMLIPFPPPAGAKYRSSSASSPHPFTFTFQR